MVSRGVSVWFKIWSIFCKADPGEAASYAIGEAFWHILSDPKFLGEILLLSSSHPCPGRRERAGSCGVVVQSSWASLLRRSRCVWRRIAVRCQDDGSLGGPSLWHQKDRDEAFSFAAQDQLTSAAKILDGEKKAETFSPWIARLQLGRSTFEVPERCCL